MYISILIADKKKSILRAKIQTKLIRSRKKQKINKS